MRAARLALGLACLLAGGAALAGCGGSGSGGAGGGEESTAAEGKPAPPASRFPSAEGRTLRQVINATEASAETKIIPAAEVFYPGPNRYPFGVFTREGGQVDGAEVALYFSRVPKPRPGAKSKSGNLGPISKARGEALDQPAVGPFPATVESLAVKPRFQSRTTANDPNAARVVYAAELDFPSKGQWRIGAVIMEGGQTRGEVLPSANVGEFHRVPTVGRRAPRIHTPTAQDVGGDLSKISTRVPPDTLNKVDYAEVLGNEPIVLLFATPKFCQSRVCGPAVDELEQARAEYGDRAAFIHMEIYNDNDPAKGARPQVRAFHLPTEPWLFTIDRRGRIAAAIEGPFGLKLLHRAVDKAIGG